MEVIIDRSSDDKYSKLRRKEAFVKGDGRHDGSYISGSMVVGGKNKRQKGLSKWSRATRY